MSTKINDNSTGPVVDGSLKSLTKPLGQQAFLTEAMVAVEMSEEAFARRLGVPLRIMQRWILPSSDPQFRDMEESVWRLVREIVADAKKAKLEHSAS